MSPAAFAGARTRAVLLGYHDMGDRALAVLHDLGFDVPLVVTHPDSPSERIWFRSVKERARALGIPVALTERDGSALPFAEQIRAARPDILLSAYFRSIIPAPILASARVAAVNLHGSYLPRYRGRVPVNWAIIHGESETGVTLHHMIAKPDAGDIVEQARVPILFEDTARDLFGRMVEAADGLLRRALPRLAAGTAPRIPQDQRAASTFGGRRPEDGRIDWTRSAVDLYNLVRAVTEPYPGAFTTLPSGGRKLLVWAAIPVERRTPEGAAPVHAPGTVVSLRPLLVATGRGELAITRGEVEGEPARDGEALAAAHPELSGARLG